LAVRAEARAPARSLVRAVPIWAWLTTIVAVSALVRFVVALRIEAPWIMVDELVYSELARGIAEGNGYSIRGATTYDFGFVYPLVIAPAYALFDSLPRAYEAVKAINAIVISLAALPAYFLARRVVPSGLAVLAALLAVALPSLAYVGQVMTENLFYPLFLCVVLLLVRALEQPTAGRQLALLALCAVAFLARAQALAFFPAAALAPVLTGTWRSFRVLYGTLGGVALLALAAPLVRGDSPLSLLGAYAVTGEHRYDLAEVGRWVLYHVAELDLYVGVVPFAALLVLLALWKRLPRTLRPFLAATASLSVFFLLEVSAFASLPSVARIEERNLFYLAPLLLIALLVWIDQGLPRPALAAGVAAVLGAALPGVIPYERLIGVPSMSETLMLLPLWRAHERWAIALDDLAALVVVLAVLAAIAFLVVPRRLALVLPLGVLAFFLAVARPISARMEYAALGALAEGMNMPHKDWVDRAVAGRGEVAVLWTGNTSRFAVWQNEMFSRSVGPIYYVNEPMGGGLPQTAARVRADGRVNVAGGPIDADFVLTDGSLTPAGQLVAADEGRGVYLYDVGGQLRAQSRVTGLHPNDTWSGPTVTYRRLDCTGGALTVGLRSDPNLYQEPSTVHAAGRTATVPPDAATHSFTVPLEPVNGVCTVTFDVSPAVVPGHGDLRRLGLHFEKFRYHP
jgi:Dolichyl-phosphate-mannose-protein mannosyltransferase